jgi:hypothetical protein
VTLNPVAIRERNTTRVLAQPVPDVFQELELLFRSELVQLDSGIRHAAILSRPDEASR